MFPVVGLFRVAIFSYASWDGKKFAGGPCGVKSSGDHSSRGRIQNGGLTGHDFGNPLA